MLAADEKNFISSAINDASIFHLSRRWQFFYLNEWKYFTNFIAVDSAYE